MAVWGGLTNSWEKKTSERKRYTHLNAEFQRIARRDRKGFLSDQCKEIEENNRMGKTRNLFNKIRDTKGTCKNGHDKGQKWYGTNRSRRFYEKVARIHRRTVQKRTSWPRWPQWYDYSPRARHPRMRSQVGLRKALSTKLVEVMEFQLSYFRPWKMMLWKCCTQYASKYGKQQWPQDWKRSVFIPIPKKGNAKEHSNYCTIALISHASKIMVKILQTTLQQYVNWELPDVQAGFRKGRGARDQIANICWSIEKAREFQTNICFCFIDYTKAFDC